MFVRLLSIAALSFLITACSTLPTRGPTANEILTEKQAAAAIGYQIVELTARNVSAMAMPRSGAADLAALARPAVDNRRIGAGDMVDVLLYEVGAALFSSNIQMRPGGGSMFDASARANKISALEVQRDGRVTLPFAGDVAIAGLTPVEAATRIERAYRGLSQQPQVQVQVVRNLTNSVLFGGLVNRQGRFDLSAANERLLDALVLMGGPAAAPQDVALRFRRDGRMVELPLMAIESGSAADLLLQPGDRIELVPYIRTITAFGALNSVREIRFEAPTVTLAEAVARAGGPAENLADPSAVFVFRDDPERPTIYSVDLLRPSGYFLAQRFQMRDDDLIYVASAAANRPTKLVDIINRLFSPVFAIREITR
ncbi:polysaccharide biosynthesis/export family protein [Pacificimonas sp. WHA3]|uniref:Polysaccharide biosynthesis/export family protein n=1 Tax=Pacificimonas pallii TaxID=2827236 RepID=A0ABS6SEQ8_9SPHN|nr:polysaccharide biosynthesis/export family protein [Pacificimonas pallii]MBV7256884.1 polysaccharide biosynthesis/export family protein [Pacificimonas pallii]